MQAELLLDVDRRTDYTFKYNSRLGRHGWLRLTPAYSVKLVKEIIKRDCEKNSHILDPFAGTATTGLAASELGFDAILFDINPFLIWLGNTKCFHFSEDKLLCLKQEFDNCLSSLKLVQDLWMPPIHNIERWWHPETITILANIRMQIVKAFGEPSDNYYHNLIWIAFSRLVIDTSSAAFNHISMSFKSNSIQYELSQIKLLFDAIVTHILSSAKSKIQASARVIKSDAKEPSLNGDNVFDVVITSPPYPNRMSYIRELRPYMYWLKFLNNANDAGALDWEAIGGTWGTATSKLKEWNATNTNLPERLYEVCEKIRLSGDKHSTLMCNYVHKYFDDMYSHLQNSRRLLKPTAKLNYIVGNSSFYGHFVDTEKILSAIMAELGFQGIQVDTIRRRNTKKGLLEFNVKASWRE